MNLYCSLLALEQRQLRSTPHCASTTANVCPTPTSNRAETREDEKGAQKGETIYSRTVSKLNTIGTSFTATLAGYTLNPTVHVHINCSGQRFLPCTETHSPLNCFCNGCKKILCEHGGLVLSVFFSAGCSDPLVALDLQHLHKPCQQDFQQSIFCRAFIHFH